MWNPAVSGMEDAHICAVLSFRRIRRYPVLPFKTAEKHVTLAMLGSLKSNFGSYYYWKKELIDFYRERKLYYER